jgi:hypothetical protein
LGQIGADESLHAGGAMKAAIAERIATAEPRRKGRQKNGRRLGQATRPGWRRQHGGDTWFLEAGGVRIAEVDALGNCAAYRIRNGPAEVATSVPLAMRICEAAAGKGKP